MINWYSIKEATVSISPIPFNGDSPTPFSKEDDDALRKGARLVWEACGDKVDDNTINKELVEIVNRGKPYRIMDDDNTVGIGVTSHFNHYDRKNKQQYEGQSLSDLAIFPEYQNKGIGREAIKLFVEEMMKDKPKWLHIAHDNRNDRAAHLYTSMGFDHPVPWNGEVTSLHMSRSDAKKKLKEWEKERLQSKAASELSEPLKRVIRKVILIAKK
jgi:ribosomal protein S18 acetylase RimI-like enzyme